MSEMIVPAFSVLKRFCQSLNLAPETVREEVLGDLR